MAASELDLFRDILMTVTLPIVALVALGGVLQRKLKLDIASLNRLQVYVVLPAFLVQYLSTGSQPLSAVWPIAWLGALSLVVLLAIGWLATIVAGVGRDNGPMVGLATSYSNSGFFGIPVAALAFGADYVVHQSVIVSLHSILVVTAGVWLLSGEKRGLIGRLASTFETPMIPAIILGLALKGFDVEVPSVAATPLKMIGSIFTPLALFTMGAQIADTRVTEVGRGALGLIVVLKLLVAPLVTLWMARAAGLPEDIAAVLTVAAAAPVGMVLTIFAVQFRNKGELATMAVLVTTVLSPLTVTLWVLAWRLNLL
ncbi:MAG: AEC family transporter [Hyphomicrobiaceae bacterium]